MAKSTHASSENLFSISAASEALNRSRRTIAKGAGECEAGGDPERVEALENGRHHRGSEHTHRSAADHPIYNGGALTGLAAETALAFEKYDQAFDEMVELPSVSERRAATYRLAALAEEAFAEHDRDVDGGLHPEHVELKGQRVCQLLVLGLEGPCGWTSSQAWEWFNADDGKDSEAA
jgi:hypothetical protein